MNLSDVNVLKLLSHSQELPRRSNFNCQCSVHVLTTRLSDEMPGLIREDLSTVVIACIVTQVRMGSGFETVVGENLSGSSRFGDVGGLTGVLVEHCLFLV
jgi:hypothetical protein